MKQREIHSYLDEEYDDVVFEYHTQNVYGEEGEIIGWEFITEEDGSLIPLSSCICNAFTPYECCCQCNSWTEEDYEEDY